MNKCRVSAHLQVTRESFQQATRMVGTTDTASFTNIWYIRLTNTGRTTATDIRWVAEYVSDEDGEHASMTWDVERLDELHPGEHYNLGLNRRRQSDTYKFTVSWTGQRGVHENARLMNW